MISKLIKELTIRPETMKLLEEKRGDLWDTDSDMDFLVSSTSEVQAIKVEVTSSRSSPMKVNNQLKKTTEK